jgi:putative aminopeptidase FrvX
MQLEGNGICGVDLGVPCRYTHSQIETCDLADMESTLALTEAAVRFVTKATPLNR